MGWRILLFGAMIGFLSPLFCFGQNAEQVGSRAEIKTFVFSGNQTFSADALRSGLVGDPDFLISSHPLAPLKQCLEVLKAKVTRGYRASGFPDVQVQAGVAENGPIKVTIVEGERFMSGEVRIDAPAIVPGDLIVRRITQAYPPRELFRTAEVRGDGEYDSAGRKIEEHPAVWRKEKPAPFGTEQQIQGRVGAALMELGYLSPKFDLRIEKGTQGKADLLVKIEDVGMPAKIASITVKGNKANSREEVLRFLQVTNGMPATSALVLKAENALMESGHFKSVQVNLAPESAERAEFGVNLEENPFSPKLSVPYSRAEKGFLRFRQWLQSLRGREETLHVTVKPMPGLSVDGLIAPGDGVFARIEKQLDQGRKYDFAMLISSNGAGFFSPMTSNRFFVPKPNFTLLVGGGLASSKDPERQSEISLYGGFSFKPDQQEAGFRWEFRWEAAPFLTLANPTNESTKLSFANGLVELKGEEALLRFEEGSGRVRSVTTSGGGVAVEMGAPEALETFLKRAGTWTNRYDSARPVSTAMSYLVGESFDAAVAFGLLQNDTSQSGRASAAIRKLFAPEALSALDEIFGSVAANQEFVIPAELEVASQSGIAAVIAGFVFRHANTVFPENSWPWTVARESVFVLKGQTQYTEQQLERLLSSDMGPLGFYTVAKLLEFVQNEGAKQFALRGLTRMQGSYFARDCELLFQGETALARLAKDFVGSIEGMAPAERTALNDVFPGTGPLLEKIAAEAKANRTTGPAELLSPLLEHLWERQLKTTMRTQLQKIAFNEPPE